MGLKYYADMNDATLSDLLRKASIKTDNQLVDFSDSIWQYCSDTGRSTESYNVFYQGETIDHGTHVPVTVSQSGAESEYNATCTAGMYLTHFIMLIHKFLTEDPDIVPEEAPLTILDRKSDVCIANNGKDTKNTRHIDRIVHFVSNGENFNMHKIDWCEGGLQLAYIVTKNFGDNYLNTRMKYIMVRLDNIYITLVQEG